MNGTMKGKLGEALSSKNSQVHESVKPNPQEVARAVQGLESDKGLTPHQHEVFEGVLESLARKEPQMVAQFAVKHEFFSGPLPQAAELNAYDEETRRVIVSMAVKDQDHTHDMQRTGLKGAIVRDRVGQICALFVALAGLGAAGYVAQYSAWAAGIIAALDLGTLVYAFLAPRSQKKTPEPEKPKAASRPKGPRKNR